MARWLASQAHCQNTCWPSRSLQRCVAQGSPQKDRVVVLTRRAVASGPHAEVTFASSQRLPWTGHLPSVRSGQEFGLITESSGLLTPNTGRPRLRRAVAPGDLWKATHRGRQGLALAPEYRRLFIHTVSAVVRSRACHGSPALSQSPAWPWRTRGTRRCVGMMARLRSSTALYALITLMSMLSACLIVWARECP